VRVLSRFNLRMGAAAAAWSALTVTGSAAADLSASLPLKAPPFATYDWSGFYFGGHVGYVASYSDWSTTGLTNAGPSQGGFSDVFDRNGPWGPMIGGVQGGYNYVFPSHFMVGFEADVSFPDHVTGTETFQSAASGVFSLADKIDLLSTARARAGYAFGNWLGYVTGGFAFDRDLLRYTQLAGTSAGVGLSAASFDQAYFTRYGWTLGLGLELGLSRNWTAKLDYSFMDFGSQRVSLPNVLQQYTSNLSIQSVQAGLNYHFGGDSGFQPLSTGVLPDLDKVLSIHGQTTWIDQGYAPYRALYTGQQSLYPGGMWRDSISFDGFVGLKLWDGAGLYYNPEVFQGYGLNGTLGIAGFPNGEAQKAGFLFPRYNTAHLFLQQVIGLGGEQESIADGPYEIEPWPDDDDNDRPVVKQDISRITLTIGKLAVPDVFDSNEYAHDPRTGFMNWSIWGAGAFDYVADQSGYTWGAVMSLHQKSWTLRLGYFLADTYPNSNDYDYELFRRGQYIAEWEQRYSLFSQPGEVQLTGWLSSVYTGSFAATLGNPALGDPSDPATFLNIAETRQTRVEYGYILNLQQAVTKDFGLFSRLSWQSGQTEIMAWTDIDKSASLGGVLQGTSWGRPDDRIGVAGAINGLSKEYQDFLALGGLGILIGDGQLNYRPEKILEAYYWYSLSKTSSLTFDYQFIADPAYNADRGPVSIFTGRFHAHF
jgi:high affinity Mn2+ porin